MSGQNDASGSALGAYRRALDAGANQEVALAVALARFRAVNPSATEWELRSSLAKALAAERANGLNTKVIELLQPSQAGGEAESQKPVPIVSSEQIST